MLFIKKISHLFLALLLVATLAQINLAKATGNDDDEEIIAESTESKRPRRVRSESVEDSERNSVSVSRNRKHGIVRRGVVGTGKGTAYLAKGGAKGVAGGARGVAIGSKGAAIGTAIGSTAAAKATATAATSTASGTAYLAKGAAKGTKSGFNAVVGAFK